MDKDIGKLVGLTEGKSDSGLDAIAIIAIVAWILITIGMVL